MMHVFAPIKVFDPIVIVSREEIAVAERPQSLPIEISPSFNVSRLHGMRNPTRLTRLYEVNITLSPIRIDMF